MRAVVPAFVAVLTIGVLGAETLSACGDKFLLVGRGPRFQRAYAAIHPASILLVLPPKSVKSAAVRDSALATALKMAGHRVDTIQLPAPLAGAFGRSKHDLVLAERADAGAVRAAVATSQTPPAIIAVVEDGPAHDTAATIDEGGYVLRTPLPLVKILNLLDDVMKDRAAARRSSAENN
jgi:hypothetical protein